MSDESKTKFEQQVAEILARTERTMREIPEMVSRVDRIREEIIAHGAAVRESIAANGILGHCTKFFGKTERNTEINSTREPLEK